MKSKYLALGLLTLGGAAGMMTSCSDDFLEEKMVSVITQDYFKTEQGLDQLVVATYNAERLRHPYTEGGFSFELGHDCGVASVQTPSTNSLQLNGLLLVHGTAWLDI